MNLISYPLSSYPLSSEQRVPAQIARQPSSPASLAGLLRFRAEHQGNGCAYLFLSEGERPAPPLTYGELDRRAWALAARLRFRELEGERALLLYPSGPEFLAAFFGCLYAGVTAVPVPLPEGRGPRAAGDAGRLARIEAVAADCRPGLALTRSKLVGRISRAFAGSSVLEDVPVAAGGEAAEATADGPEEPEVRGKPETLAYLQYTSGSTGSPRGVAVSHANVLHNLSLFDFEPEPETPYLMVSWLPVFHDMGLVSGTLLPIYHGFPCVAMSPAAFLSKPRRWLQAISDYRATHSPSPNFGFEHCLRRISPEEDGELDLSSWTMVGTGAEPVRRDTLERFIKRFEPRGFRRRAMCPAYGLAESTLTVTFSPEKNEPSYLAVHAGQLKTDRIEVVAENHPEAQVLVGCGPPAPGTEVVIVHPITRIRTEGRVGEIWVRGPSVAQGYWGDRLAEVNRETFRAFREDTGERPFLRTGDLGFLHGGELYVTGRRKDLIILRGQNHYPQDIEHSVERSHPAIRTEGSLAFSVDAEGEERLVVVAELERGSLADPDEILAAVRRSVAGEHGVQPWTVVLVRPGSVSKTSSGKRQRRAARARFEAGTLDEVARYVETSADGDVPAVALDRERLLAAAPRERRDLLVRALGARIGPGGLDGSEAFAWSLTELVPDSLRIAELQNRIRAGLEVEMPWEVLLESRSLGELADDLLRRLDGAEAGSSLPALEPVPRDRELPLSFGQERLCFLDRLTPGNPLYNLAVPLQLHGLLDVGALRRALEEVVRRHEVLRTSFPRSKDGQPTLAVCPRWRPALPVIDLEGLQAAVRRSVAERIASEEARRPFDLATGPLLRTALLRLDEGESTLLWNVHHTVFDGCSLGVLFRELRALYSGGRLAELPVGYADFAVWQRRRLEGEFLERELDWWRRELAGASELVLPTDRPRPVVRKFRGGEVAVPLPAGLAGTLRALGREHRATLFMTALAVFEMLLYRHTGERDFMVGSPFANRRLAALEGLIGFFVDNLVLRSRLSGGISFPELLDRVRRTALGAYAHQDLPFEKLVANLEPEREATRNPLFQVVFSLQDFAVPETRLGGVRLRVSPLAAETARLDLEVQLRPLGADSDELEIICCYDRDLFDRTTVRRLAGSYRILLGSVTGDPQRRLAEFALLTEAERWQALHEWNDTEVEYRLAGEGSYPHGRCLHGVVWDWAVGTPEALALTFPGGALSYGELRGRALRLAGTLRWLGVRPEVLVGLFFDRTPEYYVALLGVLEAGGAFLPLDPDYPAQRLAFILEDAGAPLVLTLRRLRENVPATSAHVVCLDEAPGDACPPLDPLLPDHLAYVMYTSGSTGRPKGVQVAHRGAANLAEGHCLAFAMEPRDRVLPFAPLAFDGSVAEAVMALASGACLHLVPRRSLMPGPDLLRILRDTEITTVTLPPSTLAVLTVAELPALEKLVCAGEALSADLVERWSVHRRFFNAYGPTENTVCSSIASCRPGEGRPTLGRPNDNVVARILDRRLRVVAAGIPGELLLGGAGVARGYLGRPALTAERFIPDAGSRRSGGRLYRTGDLARHRGDGRLEYLGRIDRQVKLRGFRVELGEIESTLRRHPAVADAVVTVLGARQLVAYVVFSPGEADPDPGSDRNRDRLAEVRVFAAERLPEFMLPARWVRLKQLPLTPNGKVDHRALPAPDAARHELAEDFAPPRGPEEAALAQIWAEVLGLDRIGVHSDFFRLGGHSLLATRAVSRIRDHFGVELALREFFEARTVARLARRLQAARRRTLPAIERRSSGSGAPVPLSFAQQRLWFLDRLAPGNPFYTVTAAVTLRGRLDIGALARALRGVVRRHDVLRTSFPSRRGEPVQIVHEAVDFHLTVVDLFGISSPAIRRTEALRIAAAEARRPFDLARAPLLRAALIRLAAEEAMLLLALHHVVSDGWSAGVLLRELQALYTGNPLPELSIQYSDFAVWQRRWLRGEVLEEQLAYWRRQLDGAVGLALPSDRPGPAVRTFYGGTETFRLPAALTRDLIRLGGRCGATLFMTLLAAFQALLHRLTGETDIVVGTPVANRHHVELEDLIGFFVNSLAIRTTLAGDPVFRMLLGHVRDVTLGAWAHQDLPFEKLVESLRPERDLGKNPWFQVVLAVQNAPLPELSLGDVELVPEVFETYTTRFDLEVHIWDDEAATGLRIFFSYDRDVFDPTTIRRLGRHYETVLRGVAEGPERSLSELPLLGAAESHQLLRAWNDTRTPYPNHAVLSEIFEEVAAEAPHGVALSWDGGQLSYGELNARANRLARHLRRRGVGPEVPVGLEMERSPELVTAILAVTKAGGAYVPLDPSYPEARRRWMVDNSGVKVRLTGARANLATESSGNLAPWTVAENLAYIMYTSGSTGRPRGVGVSHRCVVRLVRGAGYARFGQGETLLLLAPVSFDASTLELWGALLHGARLALFPPGKPTLESLGACFLRQGVSFLWLTAGLFHQMVGAAPSESLRGIRQLLAGGDVLSAVHVRRALRLLAPGAVLVNGYGPTENTTFTCCHRMSAAVPRTRAAAAVPDSVPIGRPVGNTRVYVLDRDLRPVPVGAWGELCAGGDGLARGYLGVPSRTAESFVPHPAPVEAGERLYRTGDLARWRPGGELEFRGRADRQAKVRGFRIEPGEVEATLEEHPEVRQAVVLARRQRLVAYVVPGPSRGTDAAWVDEHVGQWECVFDDLYRQDAPYEDGTFNTVGWRSSYSGRELAAEEMLQWLDDTVGRILDLEPRRVLEIGCGTGLVLFAVAPHCERYMGTDLSKAALEYVASQGALDLGSVTLSHRTALDWSGIEPGSFDTIVLNSVVQYFPSVEYLVEVLGTAARMLAPGGSLFVGDVRSLPLLEEFHLSLARARADGTESPDELHWRARTAARQEDELVLDPELFFALGRHLPRIARVEVLPKRSDFDNELTRFRYQVVMRAELSTPAPLPTGEESREEPEWAAWANRPLRGHMAKRVVSELEGFLGQRLPEYMVPSGWVLLESLPLTPNGKVDRRALPEADAERLGPAEFTAPRTPGEEKLARIWAEALELDRVGVHDDFFELGGHSLLATRVVSRARYSFGVDLSLRELFEAPTVAGLVARLEARKAEDTPRIEPLPRPGGLPPAVPLSFAQQRLWFLDRLRPDNPFYNVAVAVRLHGPLDAGALESSLREVVRRHESLRTTFPQRGTDEESPERDGDPVQVVGEASFFLPVVDLRGPGGRESELHAVADREAVRPFELTTGPLLRSVLVRLEKNEAALLLNLHHIVTDGWSMGVLLRELRTLYLAQTQGGAQDEGGKAPLPELPLQYADFAVWQRRYVAGEVFETQLGYWRRELAGAEVVELPADRPRPTVQTFRGGTETLHLDRRLCEGIRSLSRQHGATEFITLLAVFETWIHRLTGRHDLVLGSPIANRHHHPDLEKLIGFFVNTLVMRGDLSGDPTFRELLPRVREAALGAYAHQDLPFEKLVEALHPDRDLGRNPIFQVLFAVQNAPLPDLELGPLRLSTFPAQLHSTRLDLEVHAWDDDGGLTLATSYDRDLYDPTTVRRWLRHFRNLVQGVGDDPGRRLGHLPLLSAPESHQLLSEWNDTGDPLGEDRGRECGGGVERFFDAQAERTPDAVAVEAGERRLSYRELDRRAARMAHTLRRKGCGPDVLVGLRAGRSPATMVGMLGILKAGGAYVPLDPSYPEARTDFMLRDSGAALLVTEEGLIEVLAPTLPPLLLGGEGHGGAGGCLAYVIYTSGSTGRPKGVAMTHSALRNLVEWQLGDTRPGARVLQFTSLSFDVSFQEILTTWASGGTLVLVGEKTRRDPGALFALLRDARVERLFMPFVALRQLAETVAAADREVLNALQEVFTAGEQPVVTGAVVRFFERSEQPSPLMFNHYGPTEAHVVTAFTLTGPPARWPALPPIGRPVTGLGIFLLDVGSRPAPAGVHAELWIGGVGLARGYLHRPALTADRFQPHPYARKPGSRLYRTGDVARFRYDSQIEFLGRIDQQLKVRGFRVEPGEVEGVMVEHPLVREAVVGIRRQGGREDLVAYVILERPLEGCARLLRRDLRHRLPSHMVPSVFVFLDELPQTPSGKVDRRAVTSSPLGLDLSSECEGVLSCSPIEEQLIFIFSEVLGRKTVGKTEDFFDIGGHSLLATRVVSRIRQSFGVELALRELFEEPTAAGLARRVENALFVSLRGAERPVLPPIERTARGKGMPLSFAQQRLWFLDRLVPDNPFYNMPAVLRLRGPLDAEVLERACREVVRRHEVLRTSFPAPQGRPVQLVHAPGEQGEVFQAVDLGGLPAARAESRRLVARESVRPFDLTAGPLLRVTLIRRGRGDAVLLLNVHHVVFDGWSTGILLRELQALYQTWSREPGSAPPLPELPVQYADFAVWQRRWLRGEVLEGQLAYWRRKLAGAPVVELPTDRPRPSVRRFRGRQATARLAAKVWGPLRDLGRKAAATPFMTLLALFDVLVCRRTGRRDLVVGSPIANRRYAGLEGLVGFFVNTLALRVTIAPDTSFRELLGEVRGSALGAYAHQDLPFERLVEGLGLGRELRRNPLFQVLFALQNFALPELDLGELRLEPVPSEAQATRFDLEVHLSPLAEDELHLLAVYDRDLFDAATIERFCGHYETLLRAVVEGPDRPLVSLPGLDESERVQLVDEWPDPSPAPKSDAEPFEREPPVDVAALLAPRDAFELGLAGIFEELLGESPVGVRDSFFDLGGHSLLAVELMTRVEQDFGRQLPLAELFEAPTVEHLASLLRRDAPTPARRSALVPIRRTGARPPIFCAHPVGGNVFCYVELARQLGPEQPFYGLQTPDFIDEDEPSLEDLASIYVEAVREVRETGPYLLGGWSMGGVVAFEMARQLEIAGETVGLVAMMDAPPPGLYAPGSEISRTYGGDRAALLAGFARDLTGAELPVSTEELRRLGERERFDRVLEHAQSTGTLPLDAGSEQVRALFRLFELNFRALCNYNPLPYLGTVDWFRAEATQAAFPAGGWEFLAGGARIRRIHGDHYSILGVDVRALAEHLKACIEQSLL